MAKTLSNSIPYVCFLYGLSLFVFTNIMSNGNNIVGLIAFIFAIAFILSHENNKMQIVRQVQKLS